MIETGTLKKKTAWATQEVAYEMRYLDKSDLPSIMDLQSLIVSRLTRKDLLEAFPYEFMKVHINERGFIIGIFVDKELIAFRNVYFPGIDDQEWNLGYDIGLKQANDLGNVANLQMICVHPYFRGNSLALRMNTKAIQRIKRLNRYTHLCATVSPYNYWNVRILLNCGFIIKELKYKYQDKLRYVLYQHLIKPFKGLWIQHTINKRLTDIDSQMALIKEGFIGIQLNEIPGHIPQSIADNANGFEVVYSTINWDQGGVNQDCW